MIFLVLGSVGLTHADATYSTWISLAEVSPYCLFLYYPCLINNIWMWSNDLVGEAAVWSHMCRYLHGLGTHLSLPIKSNKYLYYAHHRAIGCLLARLYVGTQGHSVQTTCPGSGTGLHRPASGDVQEGLCFRKAQFLPWAPCCSDYTLPGDGTASISLCIHQGLWAPV